MTQVRDQRVLDLLQRLLASELALSLNTHNYAWNVVDPRFKELSDFFNEVSDVTRGHCDRLAKRLRTFDVPVLGTPTELLKNSFISDHPGGITQAHTILNNLYSDIHNLISNFEKGEELAESAKDITTHHILGDINEDLGHIKWRTRSFLHGSIETGIRQPSGHAQQPGAKGVTA